MVTKDIPIDFVITWVDNTDTKWQEEFLHYKEVQQGNSIETAKSSFRFRDWGTLKYWFRAVEQYAPWVNKVYFVTCGQHPGWLNQDYPKLEFVDHQDYIPSDYLPCFSPRPIELNFHRIKSLSEHFVYFNDDTFLMDNIEIDDFFLNGVPRYVISEKPLYKTKMDNGQGWLDILLNLSGVLNENFNKHDVIKRNLSVWFPLNHPTRFLNNLLMFKFKHFSTFEVSHVATPFLKSQMEVVWEALQEKLDSVCKHKFRSKDDLNQYIMIFWNVMTGHAKQCKHMHGTGELMITDSSLNRIAQIIKNHKAKMTCINDTQDIADFQKAKEIITSAFESRFPQKSKFEK